MQILTRGRGGYLGDTEDGEDSEDGTEVMFHHTKLIHTSHLLPPPAWEW
ncbi:MAG: GTPase-activating protein [Moorea sp. SIO2C4]|nr:GTPase-activating protein [Moorena sp. SIO2C4]